MTVIEILEALADPEAGEFRGALIEEVLAYLDWGMLDEWDIGFIDGIKSGFAAQELQIAAKSGLSLARFHRREAE